MIRQRLALSFNCKSVPHYLARFWPNHFETEKGEFIIVLDSRDRENEGDLIISGEGVTEKQMAFLVRYTRLENYRPMAL